MSIIILGAIIPYVPAYQGFPFKAIAFGNIPFTEIDLYYDVDGALSALNTISVVAWVTLDKGLVEDVNITEVRLLFDGSWLAPVDFANIPKTGEVVLAQHERGENIYRGEVSIMYPAEGEYEITLQVLTAESSFFVKAERITPVIKVLSYDTTLILSNNRNIRGLTFMVIGVTLFGILVAADLGSRGSKDYYKELETEP